MKKIIVSGARGFVGKHLTARLLKNKNIKLFKMDRRHGNVKNKHTWNALSSANVLVHLAGMSFPPNTWANPEKCIQSNVLGTLMALEYCKTHKTKMIFVSSYMYGNPDKLPTNEKAKIKINNPLALSKSLCEEVCKFYAKSYGLKVIILRPSNIYGPGQKNFWLIPDIINKFKMKKIVVNNLNVKRDLIYISDFVEAIIKSISLKSNFQIFNIGSGRSYSIKEIIEILKKLHKKDLSLINKNTSSKNQIMNTKLDINKAKKTLKWMPRWSLKKGLAYTVKKNRIK